MSKLSQHIWHPWVETAQEQALDLTVKKDESEVNVEKQSQFDFVKFYQTYSRIAERENGVDVNCEESFYPQNVSSWKLEKKRKIFASFPEPVGQNIHQKKIIYEANIQNHRAEEGFLKNCQTLKQNDQVKKLAKKSSNKTKKKSSSKIASIKDTCDCRFCYEDHIIRMRLKITHPYLLK